MSLRAKELGKGLASAGYESPTGTATLYLDSSGPCNPRTHVQALMMMSDIRVVCHAFFPPSQNFSGCNGHTAVLLGLECLKLEAPMLDYYFKDKLWRSVEGDQSPPFTHFQKEFGEEFAKQIVDHYRLNGIILFSDQSAFIVSRDDDCKLHEYRANFSRKKRRWGKASLIDTSMASNSSNSIDLRQFCSQDKVIFLDRYSRRRFAFLRLTKVCDDDIHPRAKKGETTVPMLDSHPASNSTGTASDDYDFSSFKDGNNGVQRQELSRKRGGRKPLNSSNGDLSSSRTFDRGSMTASRPNKCFGGDHSKYTAMPLQTQYKPAAAPNEESINDSYNGKCDCAPKPGTDAATAVWTQPAKMINGNDEHLRIVGDVLKKDQYRFEFWDPKPDGNCGATACLLFWEFSNRLPKIQVGEFRKRLFEFIEQGFDVNTKEVLGMHILDDSDYAKALEIIKTSIWREGVDFSRGNCQNGWTANDWMWDDHMVVLAKKMKLDALVIFYSDQDAGFGNVRVYYRGDDGNLLHYEISPDEWGNFTSSPAFDFVKLLDPFTNDNDKKIMYIHANGDHFIWVKPLVDKEHEDSSGLRTNEDVNRHNLRAASESPGQASLRFGRDGILSNVSQSRDGVDEESSTKSAKSKATTDLQHLYSGLKRQTWRPLERVEDKIKNIDKMVNKKVASEKDYQTLIFEWYTKYGKYSSQVLRLGALASLVTTSFVGKCIQLLESQPECRKAFQEVFALNDTSETDKENVTKTVDRSVKESYGLLQLEELLYAIDPERVKTYMLTSLEWDAMEKKRGDGHFGQFASSAMDETESFFCDTAFDSNDSGTVEDKSEEGAVATEEAESAFCNTAIDTNDSEIVEDKLEEGAAESHTNLQLEASSEQCTAKYPPFGPFKRCDTDQKEAQATPPPKSHSKCNDDSPRDNNKIRQELLDETLASLQEYDGLDSPVDTGYVPPASMLWTYEPLVPGSYRGGGQLYCDPPTLPDRPDEAHDETQDEAIAFPDWNCKHCQAVNQGKFVECVECGRNISLIHRFSNQMQLPRCSFCHALLDEDQCPSCGTVDSNAPLPVATLALPANLSIGPNRFTFGGGSAWVAPTSAPAFGGCTFQTLHVSTCALVYWVSQ